ncbi:response regulator [Chitinispirillum alkaliphilum]|nr:response regulator [Chitinispirillum alkaliphilum]
MESSILVVDTHKDIFDLVSEIFSAEGVEVRYARSADEALRAAEQNVPQVIMSGVDLPQNDGFELLRSVKEKHPRIKRVLMSSYDVDSYVTQIRKHNIGNILVKGSGFCSKEIRTYLRSLLKGDIFGLNRYFPGRRVHGEKITSYSRAREICSEIASLYPGGASVYLDIAADELISNAVFHGVLQLTGTDRGEWSGDQPLSESDAISVTWACDDEKVGVSVVDTRGNLKKMDVLHWLYNSAEVECAFGEQEHGRGLLLIRRIIDRFIINIDPGHRTECVILQYFDKEHVARQKPLLIHELA